MPDPFGYSAICMPDPKVGESCLQKGALGAPAYCSAGKFYAYLTDDAIQNVCKKAQAIGQPCDDEIKKCDLYMYAECGMRREKQKMQTKIPNFVKSNRRSKGERGKPV